MSPHVLAVGLRRDWMRSQARIRELDAAGKDHAAFEESLRCAAIEAEIAECEGVSRIGLVTQHLPLEMLL